MEWEAQTDWNVTVPLAVDIHPASKTQWRVLCRPVHAAEWRETPEQTDCRAKQPRAHKWLLLGQIWSVEKLETLPAGTDKAKDTRPLIAWRREALLRGSARRSSVKGRERAIVNQTSRLGTAGFKGNVGQTSERRGGAHMGFSERRIDTILNRTELCHCGVATPVDSHWLVIAGRRRVLHWLHTSQVPGLLPQIAWPSHWHWCHSVPNIVENSFILFFYD